MNKCKMIIGASFSNLKSFQINLFDKQGQLVHNKSIEGQSLNKKNIRWFTLEIPKKISLSECYYNYEKQVDDISLKEDGKRHLSLEKAEYCDEWNKQHLIIKLESKESLKNFGFGLMEGKTPQSFSTIRKVDLKQSDILKGETYISMVTSLVLLKFYIFSNEKQFRAEFIIKVSDLQFESNSLVFVLINKNVLTLMNALSNSDPQLKENLENQLKLMDDNLEFKRLYQIDGFQENKNNINLIPNHTRDNESYYKQINSERENLKESIQQLEQFREQTSSTTKTEIMQDIYQIECSEGIDQDIIIFTDYLKSFFTKYDQTQQENLQRPPQINLPKITPKKNWHKQGLPRFNDKFRETPQQTLNPILQREKIEEQTRLQLQNIQKQQEKISFQKRISESQECLQQENNDLKEEIKVYERKFVQQKKEIVDGRETCYQMKQKMNELKEEKKNLQDENENYKKKIAFQRNQLKDLQEQFDQMKKLSQGKTKEQYYIIKELKSQVQKFIKQEISFLNIIEKLKQENKRLTNIIEKMKQENNELNQKLMQSEFDYSQLIHYLDTLRPQTAAQKPSNNQQSKTGSRPDWKR